MTAFNNSLKSLAILCSILLSISCESSKSNESQSLNKIAFSTTEKLKAKEETQEVKIDTLRGIDVSHYQGDVDWAKVKTAGMHFGIAKSTEGLSYVDPKFNKNWKNIAAAGLYRGTYHFFVANDDPLKQADHFINTVGSIENHHINPILDLEASIGDLTVEQYQKNVLIWLNRVEEKMGVLPLIYTDHPFGNANLNNEKFSKYKLWLAEYGAKHANVPDSWSDKGWSAWQFTSHDHLNGVNGNVDESKFLSSLLINQ